jgi:hypothetical protein
MSEPSTSSRLADLLHRHRQAVLLGLGAAVVAGGAGFYLYSSRSGPTSRAEDRESDKERKKSKKKKSKKGSKQPAGTGSGEEQQDRAKLEEKDDGPSVSSCVVDAV